MLGPPKSRRLDAPIAVSLEALVPPDNFYRHLERKLVETASLHLAHRWYLGYALDEELPDHSSLTRIRQRLGVDVFQRFFEKVVDLCQAAELVWGRELFFDATKVEANADVDTLVPRFYRAAKLHLDDLFAAEPNEGGGAPAPGPPQDEAPAGVARFPGEHPAASERPWRLLDERRLDPARPLTRGDDRLSGWLVSTTDPDATPMRTGARTLLGSHDHDVVDGGKARVILAALVTPADVMENAPMRDLRWRVRFRRKVRPRHVTADATDGTLENVAAVEGAGIRAYVPRIDFAHRSPFSGRDAFAFDAERDAYRCPEGQFLRRYAVRATEEVVVYRGDPATCNACPVKAACTKSHRGRMVFRPFGFAHLERVRSHHATEAYARSMAKRQVGIEPLVAEGKQWHGLRRFRLRGLANVNCAGLLVAAGQNFKRWLAATGWGRRHAPCDSLVALLRPPHRPVAVLG